MWRCAIQRPARPRALASRSWVRARAAARCASPEAPEFKSMSDEKKPAAPKGDKAKKAKAEAAPTGEAKKKMSASVAGYEPRLKERYRSQVRARLKEQFNYTNEMQIPAIDKVVINMG